MLAEIDMIYAYFLRSKWGKTPEVLSIKRVRLKTFAQKEKGILHGKRGQRKGKRGASLTRPRIFLTNKEVSTVLCSVVKHAGSGRERKKCRGKHVTQSRVFPHFLSALTLHKCFTTEQSTVEASIFVL